MSDDKLIASGAYKLFFEELHKHLETASSVLSGAPSSIDESRLILGAAFHTIRGSAGFFGLSQIAKISHELEDLLLTEESKAPVKIKKVKSLVDELQTLVSQLPNPK